MALSTNVTYNGIQVDNAYIRILDLTLKNKTELVFNTGNFKESTEKQPFECGFFACSFNLDGANPYVQAYEYLKTLPQYAGAIDC